MYPTKHIMDNEVSELLKDNIQDEFKLKLVPPGCHRWNVAEVSIKTFKDNFIAILEGLPDSSQIPPQSDCVVNSCHRQNSH